MYEWEKCQDGVFARELQGGEKIFYALEKDLDGHVSLGAADGLRWQYDADFGFLV
jgi:hypothetical protein